MKKNLLLLSFISFSALNAQTLTQSTHEPIVGDVEEIRRLDTSGFTSGIPLGITGANSVWDFSQAVPANSNTIMNTYVAPATYTHGTMFTGATVVQNLDSKMYNYFKSSAGQAEIVGIYTSTLALTFTNSALVIEYPASLGSTTSDQVSGTYTAGVFNGPFQGSSETAADGTGTLMLQGGITYTDVIRIKTVQTLTLTQGTATGLLRQAVYNYYSASMKFPIINVSYISFSFGGAPTVMAAMHGNAESLVTGVRENSSASVLGLFPNPATDHVSVQVKSGIKGEMNVFDITGAKVLTVPAVSAAGPTTIDISSLSAGLYFLQVETGEAVVTRKFVVK